MSTARSTPARASFPARADSVIAARRFLRETLRDRYTDEVVDDAVLLVSELATNAVVHAGTTFDVTCVAHESGLRVEVHDRHPTRDLPTETEGPHEPTREGGRGLQACAVIATAWGTEYGPSGKTVWFRLAAPTRAVPAEDGPESHGPAGIAVVNLDRDGLVTGWNPDAHALLGWSAGEVLGHPLTDLVRPATPLPEGGDGPTTAELELRHHNGEPVRLFGLLLPADSGAVWLLTLPAWRWLLDRPSTSPPSHTEPDRADWATFRPEELAGLRPPDLLRRVAERVCDAFGGDAAYVMLTDEQGGSPEVAAVTGLPDVLTGSTPAVVHGVAGRLLRERLPAVYEDLAAPGPRVPLLVGTGMRSAVTVPLLVETRVVGQLGVASAEPGRFGNQDAEAIQRATEQLALTVEGCFLADLARRHRGWLGYLAEASDLLAGTLDPRMTLSMLTQLVVPRLATWCAVHVPGERGESTLSHVWHEDETRVDRLWARLNRACPKSDEDRPTFGRLGDDATLTVPLRARGRMLGSVTLGRPVGDRFDGDTVDLAEELCRRAALTLDNALLYHGQVSASQTLQRSLLPTRMPDVPGMEFGVAYEAAGEGHQVGGDFYDLFEIAPGRWRFTIGDVCGSGPEAASVTGLARNALRILGGQGHPVAEVLAQLNRAVLMEHGATPFLTVLHGELRPHADGGAALSLVSAGHPLPYLLAPGQEAREVATPQPLLGVIDSVSYTEDLLDLGCGEALLCVTDGVLERRNGRRMLGEHGLAKLLAECVDLSAPAIAATVRSTVVDYAPHPPSDDLAVLVVRAA